MEKKKIIFFLPSLSGGGNEKNLIVLLNGLVKKNKFIIFLATYRNINKDKKLINVKTKKQLLVFRIVLKNDKEFMFYYDIGSNIRSHFINKVNLDNFKNNPIKDMLNTILYKNFNFVDNNLTALKCIELIDMIKNYNR